MQDTLKQLLAELHAGYFKPNGFKKVRNKFRRESEGVIQEVEFQSSQWNIKGEAILFYVNFRIGFTDIAAREGFHGDGRISGLVSSLPAHYELLETNSFEIRDELTANSPKLFEILPNHYEDVRQRALKGWMTSIPMPDSWRAVGQA